MMQDAICPKCGMIFRVRAHTKDCVEAPHDDRFVDLALAIHRDFVARELKRLEGEEDE